MIKIFRGHLLLRGKPLAINKNSDKRKNHYGAFHKRTPKALSDKQFLLVQKYFEVECNQREAMRQLGYTESSCSQSQKFFGHPAVEAEIRRIQQDTLTKFELSEEWVIIRMMAIANADMGKILLKLQENKYDLRCLSKDESYAIQEFVTEEYTQGRGSGAREVTRIKIKPADRKSALDSLARRLGLFQDNVNVSGEVSLVDRLVAGRKRVADAKKDA